jgi:hypothetical protein
VSTIVSVPQRITNFVTILANDFMRGPAPSINKSLALTAP